MNNPFCHQITGGIYEMNREKLKVQWKQEEAQAHIHGWDFSHIDGRYEEENDLPWNYELLVRKY